MPIAATYSLIVQIAIKSAVVIGVARIIVALLRGKSAALRHLIWSVAFAGVLTLPLFSIALPALRVPVRPSLAISELVFRTEAISPSRQPPAAASDSGSATKTIPVMADWRVLFLLIWAGGAAISLAQMLMAWISVERLRLTARQSSEANFAVLARRLRVEKKVLLFEGSAGSMPMTYGLFRPAIFIPADANNWTAERRRIVLLHELAHVRRGDGATHLMARLALILYWWNPLVWVAWREFLKEGELAADDLVLNLGACGSEYATHLLEIARSMQTPGISGWPVVAMASRSQLEGRLEAILDSQRDRRAPRTMMAAVVLLGSHRLDSSSRRYACENGCDTGSEQADWRSGCHKLSDATRR
jgi:beta-lactamase regulating signal transducer with metallopeptidase domain